MTLNFTTDTAGLSHSANITGLANGTSYRYYARCLDMSGNVNTADSVISFSIDTARTAQQVLTNSCNGCHTAWSTFTDANFQTAGLVVAKSPGTSVLISRIKYGGGTQDMPSPVTSPAFLNFTMTDYNAIVTWINAMTPVATDVVPPVRSGGLPTGTLTMGTTSTTLRVTTSEAADCRYATTVAIPFASMTLLMTPDTAKTTHTANLTGLINGTNYFYSLRCKDTAGNANTDDYTIAFSVMGATDTTPPAISNLAPSGPLSAGSVSATLSLATNESATCRYATTAGTTYALMTNTFLANSAKTGHSSVISNLQAGSSYIYYVRCIDSAGNANATDASIAFSVPSTMGMLLYSSSESIRISDRILTKSILDGVFGPAADAKTITLVSSQLSKFGGPCDFMGTFDRVCANVDMDDIGAAMMPVSVTPREGQRMKACNALSFDDALLSYAIKQATGKTDLTYLNTTPTPTIAEMSAAYELFNPGRSPLPSLVTDKLTTVANSARTITGATSLDPWRFVLLTICYAPDWQAL